jgi:hypothetical protein
LDLGMNVPIGTKEASISMVVITADGRQFPIGIGSYYHRSPFRRWLMQPVCRFNIWRYNRKRREEFSQS